MMVGQSSAIHGEVPIPVKLRFQNEVKRRGIKQKDALADALNMWANGGPVRKGLPGEVHVGDKLWWEPTLPHASCFIQINEIKRNSDGEVWLKTDDCWNELGRVREACVRPEDWNSGAWRNYHPIDVHE